MNISKKLADNLAYFVNNTSKRCKITNEKNGVDSCQYSGKTLGLKTKGCFVGAMLPAPLRISIDEKFPDGIDIQSVLGKKYEKIPAWMYKHPGLLGYFQCLHDIDTYWNKDSGLSNSGKDQLKHIISKYNLNIKDFKKFL